LCSFADLRAFAPTMVRLIGIRLIVDWDGYGSTSVA
jgi:hypothetical protein